MKGNQPLQPTWPLPLRVRVTRPFWSTVISGTLSWQGFSVVGIRSKAWLTSYLVVANWTKSCMRLIFQTWISSSLDRSRQTQQVSCKARTSLWWWMPCVSILTISLSIRLQLGSWSMRPLSPNAVMELSWSQNLVPMDARLSKRPRTN